jgi:hypothetical protein
MQTEALNLNFNILIFHSLLSSRYGTISSINQFLMFQRNRVPSKCGELINK